MNINDFDDRYLAEGIEQGAVIILGVIGLITLFGIVGYILWSQVL